MKILIGVNHADYANLADLANAQKQTWASVNDEDVQIIWATGKNSWKFFTALDARFFSVLGKPYLGSFAKPFMDFLGFATPKKPPKYAFNASERSLKAKCLSTKMLSTRKNLAVLNYFLNETIADFYLQVNSSSYVNITTLKNFLKRYSGDDEFASGELIRDPIQNNPPVITGAGRLLSRFAARKIMENFKMLKHNTVEDLVMGRVINELQIKTLEVPMKHINSSDSVEKINEIEGLEHYIFWCKSGIKHLNDAQIMKDLHMKLQSK